MNLANKITISRILLIPVFMIVLLTGLIDETYSKYIACFIFVAAASTDALDGYIARKRKQITNFGKFLDPIADKLLVAAALIALVEMGRLASWVVVVIIAREFIVSSLRMIAAVEGEVIAASVWGKIKTIFQMIAISLLLIDNFPFSVFLIPVDQIILYFAVLFTLVSGVDYVYKNRKIIDFNK